MAVNVLALDTACGETSACLFMRGKTWLPQHASAAGDGKTRSERIIPLLENLLSQAGAGWSDLEALAFGHGPGSFTGLRIAAATLAGLNSSLQLPVISISSLAISSRQTEGSGAIRILEDARAGEAYVGHYRDGSPLAEDACLSWSEVTERFSPSDYACHAEPPVQLSGWNRLPLTIERHRALAEEVAVQVAAIENLAGLPAYPEPLYLQLSQAERNAHV